MRQVGRQALAAHQGLEAVVALPWCVQQHAPHARRGLHDRGAAGLQQSIEQVTVHRGVARHDHDLRAHSQRQHQLEYRDVERQGRDGGQAVVRLDARLDPHAGQEVGNSAVRQAHALGLSGRAGGVDDVGRVGRAGVFCTGRQGVGRFVQPRGVHVQPQHPLRGITAPRQRRGRDRRLGQQQDQVGVFGVVGQTCGRKARVERNVGGAGLQHRQQGDHHVGAAAQAQAHAFAALDAAGAQGVRQAVGALVQIPIAQLGVCVAQGQTVRRGGALAHEGCVHQVGRHGTARRLQCGQRTQLLRCQPVEPPDGLLGLCHGGAQQRLVSAHPARDRRGIEQLGVVLAFEPQAAIDLRRIDEQFEVLEVARIDGELDRQFGVGAGAALDRLVDVEHDADQRQTTRVAPDRQLLQQGAVGQGLVVEGVQQRSA